jgi:hypothetical protein
MIFFGKLRREGKGEKRGEKNRGPDRQKLWVEGIDSDSEVID